VGRINSLYNAFSNNRTLAQVYMPVTTIHEYLDNYPYNQTYRRMIVGTIHPHMTENFNIPFFYGNVGSFWDILGQAFPQHNFLTLDSIQQVLSNYQTWVTDIIRQCDRENSNITRDDLLYNLVLNEDQIGDALNESEIETIYFTSRFGKNNAAKLFTKVFHIRYRQTYNINTSEFLIPKNRFGRQIRCIVLYSPSNDANKGIAGGATPYLNNIAHYQQFLTPVKQFKIEFYQEKFAYLIND
jgi:hypothetical protein